ncbi:MAG: putative porin protein [Massilia sp.]|jgi:predicted porin|nr:putative porin protein [Massilia sp.]MDB5951472.1 putative porin protein [Massilia sp.]
MIKNLGRLGLAAGVLWVPFQCHAQEEAVQIYGKLYPQVNNVRTTGATARGTPVSTLGVAPTGLNLASKFEEESSDSWFGFRGTEKLGNDWKLIWQIEGNAAVDNGSGSIAGRNTHIGVSGPLGTLRLGKIDTVYKSIGDTLSFLGVGPRNHVSHNNVISKAGFGTNISSSFHLRRDNSIRYESPKLGGFQVLAQYSPDEAKTETRNADLGSYGVTYARGDLYLALAYEIHNDFFGGSRNSPAALSNFANLNARSKDTATRASAKYAIGKTTVEFDYAWKKYQETGGAARRYEQYKNGSWLIGVEHKLGAVTLATSYMVGGAGSCSLVGGFACSTDGLDARQINLGAAYALSKRTYLYAIASNLKNGKSSTFSNMANDTPAAGADITQASLGISHSF